MVVVVDEVIVLCSCSRLVNYVQKGIFNRQCSFLVLQVCEQGVNTKGKRAQVQRQRRMNRVM